MDTARSKLTYSLILIVGFLTQGAVAQALLGTGGVDLALPGLTIPFVVVALLFFVGGFVLYSTLYAAAGSMVSRQEDVQQAGAPLMILAMAGGHGHHHLRNAWGEPRPGLLARLVARARSALGTEASAPA